MTRSTGIFPSLAAALLAVLLLAACSGSPATPAQGSLAEPAQPEQTGTLPAPAELDSLSSGLRSASSDKLNLLGTLALATSTEGAAQLPGFLGLDVGNVQPAWALFAAPGLEPGGAIVPSGLTTVFNKPFYLGIANFATGRWQWQRRSNIGTLPISNGAELVSPEGRVYIAALAWEQNTDITQLELRFSGEVPASPALVVNLPGNVVSGYELSYSALGSTPGSGAVFTAVYYDFGDGTGTVLETDPANPVLHTYAQPGSYTLTVRVDNDLGYSDQEQLAVEAGPGNTELIVVCNADIPESRELADYYMSPVTGRGIAQDHRLELSLGSVIGSTVEREVYETGIRDPIKAYITGNGLTDSLKYILLFKGVPHRINGSSEDFNVGDGIQATASSVDNELCTLFGDDQYAYEAWLWNGPVFETFLSGNSQQFHLSGDTPFSHGTFKVSGPGAEKYDLDYLVGRIDAYTWQQAHDIIDRALQADTSGTGWVILDSTSGGKTLDTMVKPVANFSPSTPSGLDLLSSAGMNVYSNDTDVQITASLPDLPAGAATSVLGYCSWGVHSGFPAEYVLSSLGFSYVNGACFLSYESFNGTDFDDSDGIQRRGQGQLADFLSMGGTVGVGNAWEPYTLGVGDERWTMDRYLNHGDRWIEAAYKGQRLLSWMEVMVGDPLCMVK